MSLPAVLASLHFGAPWALLALLVLPLIWLLLRATPPAPLRVIFPPLALLRSLKDEEESPDSTPLWLLLLRLAIVFLLIAALAEPLWSPKGQKADDTSSLVLIVDNGWASAPGWVRMRKNAAGLAGGGAARVALVFTAIPKAPVRWQSRPAARAVLGNHQARAWPPERKAVLAPIKALIKAGGLAGKPRFVWLSDGLDYGHAGAFMGALAKLGEVQVFTPAQKAPPHFLFGPVKASARGLDLTLMRHPALGAQSVTVQALDKDGVEAAQLALDFAPGQNRASGEIELPLPVRNRLQLLRLADTASAGSSWIFGSGWARPLLGLIARGGDIDRQPLLSGFYYLNKALAPHAQIRRGVLDDLLKADPSVLVLTDPAFADEEGLQKLDDFVRRGGLLIRFAGPHLAAQPDDLIPVHLRSGGRLMGGAFGWQSPQKLAPFDPSSPYYGLAAGADAQVRRQVLALPESALNAHVWARLLDGTPLVTSASLGQGRLVLFHVTASPEWSDLPLSGLFEAMLARTLAFSKASANTPALANNVNWVQEQALSARGQLRLPAGAALQVHMVDGPASAWRPPGLYRNGPFLRAVNIGGTDTALKALPAAPAGVRMMGARTVASLALKRPMLLMALALAAVDLLAALLLAGRMAGLRKSLHALVSRHHAVPVMLLGVLLLAAPRVQAQGPDKMLKALHLAQSTHLAYMLTGEGRVDAMSKAGMFGLSMVLRQRTTVEPDAPAGVNPAQDELSVFSLIYWPVLRPPELSPKARAALQRYLKNGGMLVIDTQDEGLGAKAAGGTNPALAALFSQLSLPPLQPIAADHVLTRSYYLISSFAGRTTGGRLWVEADARGSSLDGVSGVVVGSNDWAAAWALDAKGRPMAALSDEIPRQREMARRFGVNLVMYALTGNYKADQVHIPALLKRLGQP